MGFRELAMVVVAGTTLCLSACSKEGPTGTAETNTDMAELASDSGGTYTAAFEGNVSSLIPLKQIYGVHAFFNEPGNEVQIQLASKYTQYAWQNYSRFQNGSIVARWGEPSDLSYALDPSIDSISVDFADGSTLTVDEFIDQKPVDGFIVIKDGKILYERYETMRPFDKHIWFSSSKVVGSTLLALLEAEGQIDLSRPVSDFIAELKGSAWDTVSVQETVDMATGLNGTEHDEPNHDSRTNPEQIWFQWAVSIGVFKSDGQRPKPWDVLKKMERRQAGHQAFEYNSINTFVIDNIVERVSGETIMELFGEKVWRRIGAEGDAFIGVSLDGNPLTFGLINTNLRDFARFGMIFTPMAKDVFGVEIVPATVVKHIQTSGRPDMFGKAYVGGKMFKSFFKDKDTGLSNAYMWDTIFPDGDIYKAGVGGQGVYISPATNIVVAYFMTGTGNDGPETVARTIVNKLGGR